MVPKLTSKVDTRVTLGNIVTIVTFLVGWSLYGSIWYSQVQTHIEDSNIHKATDELDRRIHEVTAPEDAEARRRLANIERIQEETLRVLYQVKGTIDKGR